MYVSNVFSDESTKFWLSNHLSSLGTRVHTYIFFEDHYIDPKETKKLNPPWVESLSITDAHLASSHELVDDPCRGRD